MLTVDGSAVGSHPLVVRFMKGVYNMKPPVSRYKAIWDVNVVLNYLQGLSPLTSLNLKDLSLKLVMLLAITTAQRLQTLQLLNIGLMKIENTNIVFSFDSPLKQSTPRQGIKPLVVKKYLPDTRLCVFTVLKEYLKRTETLRDNEQQLLSSYQRPFRKVFLRYY